MNKNLQIIDMGVQFNVLVLLDYPGAIEYLICAGQKIILKIEHSWLCKVLAHV